MTIYSKVKVTPLAKEETPYTIYQNGSFISGGVNVRPAGDHSALLTQGNNISGYHQKVKSGELLPHTAFNQVAVKNFQWSGYNLSVERQGNPDATWEGTNFASPLSSDPKYPPMPDLSGAGAELQRAASRIMSKGFDALTFIGEVDKSASMIRNVNRTFARLLRDKRNVGRNVYRAYLEGKYGWNILARELSSLHDTVQNFDRKRTIWSERSGYSFRETDSGTNTFVLGGAWGSVSAPYSVQISHSIRGSVTASVDVSQFRINPINTAWELIPLSFVIDWALQVGDAINAIHLVSASRGVTSSIGTLSTLTGSEGPCSTTSDASYKRTCTGGNVMYSTEVSRRMPSSVPLSPQVPQRVIRPSQFLDLTAIVRAKRLWG